MRKTIELPDTVYRSLERVAHTDGLTIEQAIVRAVERRPTHQSNGPQPLKRVTLPLLTSTEPGTLDLRDFDFDDLLT